MWAKATFHSSKHFIFTCYQGRNFSSLKYFKISVLSNLIHQLKVLLANIIFAIFLNFLSFLVIQKIAKVFYVYRSSSSGSIVYSWLYWGTELYIQYNPSSFSVLAKITEDKKRGHYGTVSCVALWQVGRSEIIFPPVLRSSARRSSCIDESCFIIKETLSRDWEEQREVTVGGPNIEDFQIFRGVFYLRRNKHAHF